LAGQAAAVRARSEARIERGSVRRLVEPGGCKPWLQARKLMSGGSGAVWIDSAVGTDLIRAREERIVVVPWRAAQLTCSLAKSKARQGPGFEDIVSLCRRRHGMGYDCFCNRSIRIISLLPKPTKRTSSPASVGMSVA